MKKITHPLQQAAAVCSLFALVVMASSMVYSNGPLKGAVGPGPSEGYDGPFVCPDSCNPACSDYDMNTCNGTGGGEGGSSEDNNPLCSDICNPSCSDFSESGCNGGGSSSEGMTDAAEFTAPAAPAEDVYYYEEPAPEYEEYYYEEEVPAYDEYYYEEAAPYIEEEPYYEEAAPAYDEYYYEEEAPTYDEYYNEEEYMPAEYEGAFPEEYTGEETYPAATISAPMLITDTVIDVIRNFMRLIYGASAPQAALPIA